MAPVLVFVETTMMQPLKTAAVIGNIRRAIAAHRIEAEVHEDVVSVDELPPDAPPDRRISRLLSALQETLNNNPKARVCVYGGGALMGGSGPTGRYVIQATFLATGGRSISTECRLVFNRPDDVPARLAASMDREEQKVAQRSPPAKKKWRRDDVVMSTLLSGIVCEAMKEDVNDTQH